MRKKLAQVLSFGAIVAGVIFVVTCIYGFSNWPAAPIRDHGAGYRDKQGKTYTVEEYQSFKTWEVTMGVSVASCFALAFAGQILGKGDKHKTKRAT